LVLDDNEAAHQLYTAAGFAYAGERQLAPGSSVRHERRMRTQEAAFTSAAEPPAKPPSPCIRHLPGFLRPGERRGQL